MHPLTGSQQVASCEDLAGPWRCIASGLIRALAEQLRFVETDLFTEALTSDNFLRPALSALAAKACLQPAIHELYEAGEQLIALALARFGLDIQRECVSIGDGEDEPMVVHDDDTLPDADPTVSANEILAPLASERMAWMIQGAAQSTDAY